MPGLMFDSDTPDLLLHPMFHTCRVATYADLMTQALADQLAGRLVVIDRGLGDPLNLATVADVESGALSLNTAVDRMRGWQEQGRPSVTIYHSRDIQHQVDQATQGMGISNWVATLDGTLLPDGRTRAAVQFAPEQAVGMHADLSIVWDDGWHPLAVAPPQPLVLDIQHFTAEVVSYAGQLAGAVKQLG